MPQAPGLLLAAALLVAAPAAALAQGGVTLHETGSTLILPVFEAWAAAYGRDHAGVALTTEGSGSERGILAAMDGSAQIGASDAFLSGRQTDEHPGLLDVALAISAQTVNYNLPGLDRPLRLDGPVLAGIYAGRIRDWDDRAIAALNPGAVLPRHPIVPVHRADGSGDTFVFTQYLSFTTEAEETAGFFTRPPSWSSGPGAGTTIAWPAVEGAREATGNAGMVSVLGQVPYSVGYVGITFEGQARAAGLGTALMRGHDGQFLPPTAATITSAAAALTPRTPPDERLSLVNAPGPGCYPLVNYEYAVVASRQADPATAAALRRFLLWASVPDEANQALLAAHDLLPLPPAVWARSAALIDTIR